MNAHPLSLAAWSGGGIAGAVLAPKHRLAGGALGAILVGAITDKLIERHQQGLPMTGAAVTGLGLIALTMFAAHSSK